MGDPGDPAAAVHVSDAVDPTEVAALRWAWAQESDPTVGPWRADRDFVAAIATWIARSHRTMWSARTQQRDVGIVCLTEHTRMPSPRVRAEGRWGYLGHLYVHTDFRGAGVGRLLIDAVVQAAQDRDYSKVVLSPTRASIPLYERCGFTASDELMLRTLR